MTNQYAFRESLVDTVIEDLVGPRSDEEIIDDPPLTHYLAGILYPCRATSLDPSLDNETTIEGDENATADPPVAMAHVRYPSSMGITFAVDASRTKAIQISLKAAVYVEQHSESARAPIGNTPSKHNATVWRRRPLILEDRIVSIQSPLSQEIPLGDTGLGLYIRIRTSSTTNAIPVTVVLVNRRKAAAQGPIDADAIFQPCIEVTGSNPTSGTFTERPIVGAQGTDEDIRSYRLLYRHAREFAIGHGCSAEWTTSSEESAWAIAIRSTFTPSYNVLLADSNPGIQLDCTNLQFLAKSSRATVTSQLEQLCQGYESWIRQLRESSPQFGLDLEQIATAADHLKSCEQSLQRMRSGIATLQSDDLSWEAFSLMNKAMLTNRARSVWLKNGKSTPQPIEDDSHSWRPFQLAFILVCITGIANNHHPDREVADLLWFPTGGGKTEAYLGLIAFTTFHRRLQNPDNSGITALMRYTLRLLTIQQFERAALLICCCERIRIERKDLGTSPITLGMWLGKGATPNTLQETRDSLNALRQGRTLQDKNPVQLHRCPWCGTPLDSRNYWIDNTPKLVVSCRTDGCDFRNQLPVWLVDEDVYNHRPTLLIATVDKFASLPWLEQTASLFNLPTTTTTALSPPDLIIQDELHLISGPLGTLVGLYETALDAICSKNGARPKVIASTATIRRAQRQSRGLFNRSMQQFPPSGIDARDSYFAVEAPPADKGTRRYLGLMAPGASHTTLMVRVYAALLQSAKDLPGDHGARDPYWTLVGYFNSLRVLGGAKLQISDDVSDRIALLSQNRNVTPRELETTIELTSRQPSSEIPKHLSHMAVSLPSSDTLDVILATNMISVGVDIDRLGLMAVMGQPQSTSEYIQSTSRVGRKFPGLVVVLFNSSRSRDRSHYESFVSYHSALYRQVESTSVTPFSARARDRGLHAILVSLARMLVPGLLQNKSAGLAKNYEAELQKIKLLILERIRSISPDESAAAEHQLDELISNWVNRGANISYRKSPRSTGFLLCAAGEPEPDDIDSLPTLWSLRDVDQESNLFLIKP